MNIIENNFFKSLIEFQILIDNNEEINITFPRICLIGIQNLMSRLW